MTIFSTRFTRHVTVAALLVATLSAAPVRADPPPVTFSVNPVPHNPLACPGTDVDVTFTNSVGKYWALFYLPPGEEPFPFTPPLEITADPEYTGFCWSQLGGPCNNRFSLDLFVPPSEEPVAQNELTVMGSDPTNPDCVDDDGGEEEDDGGEEEDGEGGGFGFDIELRHYLQRPGALPDTL
jgi:hypothetical protein